VCRHSKFLQICNFSLEFLVLGSGLVFASAFATLSFSLGPIVSFALACIAKGFSRKKFGAAACAMERRRLLCCIEVSDKAA